MVKRTIPVAPLVGVPYGSVFEVQSHRFVPVEGRLEDGMDLETLLSLQAGEGGGEGAGEGEGEAGGEDEGENEDGSGAQGEGAAKEGAGAGSASGPMAPGGGGSAGGTGAGVKGASGRGVQSLQSLEIQGLKQGGASGASIVAALVGNSATFASKTVFSQQKYVKRKALQ